MKGELHLRRVKGLGGKKGKGGGKRRDRTNAHRRDEQEAEADDRIERKHRNQKNMNTLEPSPEKNNQKPKAHCHKIASLETVSGEKERRETEQARGIERVRRWASKGSGGGRKDCKLDELLYEAGNMGTEALDFGIVVSARNKLSRSPVAGEKKNQGGEGEAVMPTKTGEVTSFGG